MSNSGRGLGFGEELASKFGERLASSKLAERLGALGFERFRRALAALALSFFAILYTLLALQVPEGWGPALGGLAACYVVAFFAVSAEWFWGRWFATGIGWSGIMVAVIGMFQVGWVPALAIYGALHALVVLPLAGRSMAARYDLQEGWRARYKMDDFGVARLRKTITRAAASLPSVILWALGPKQPGQGMLLALVTMALALAGMAGLVRLRTWGWLAVGASGLVALGAGHLGAPSVASLGIAPELAGTLLLAAAIPFAAPAFRFLRQRRA
jgi:hypothetical protein